ncbi:MAG: hypothetical protein RL318_2055 [Fibrobacterota bacterium]|jgi:hypothetical protein
MILGLNACNGVEAGSVEDEKPAVDTRPSLGTLIKPAPPFAGDLATLNLWLPSNGSKPNGPIAFTFDTTGSAHGMILLFDRDPGTLVNGRLSQAWNASGCIGGLVSMAGMSWTGGALLDDAPNAKGFHACGASEHEPIDPTRPLTTAALKDGQKVWWVVVGYDSTLRPVASSPVYFFVWRR